MTQTATDNATWIDAWLETQRGWLGRWQTLTMEQRVDATRVAMETMRQQFNPATLSSEALNVVQSFQSLLQSCMVQAASMNQELNLALTEGEAGNQAARTLWQQLIAAFPLGYAREQQVAWQEYLKAQGDYQARLQAVLQAFATVFKHSLEAVPAQVEARAQSGKTVQGFRELYELWIECGEQAFAELAHDAAFISAQAACGNALSRLKRAQQALLDYWLKSYDLPTRAELNTVHQRMRDMNARVAELEQQLAAATVGKATAVKKSRSKKS